MSNSNNQYIKFMSDIIDSGLWGILSPSAKTLYPVLLKLSDQNFKQVWPGTDTLLKLTGFKTKKSILLGKKELIKHGLLHYKPGSGRTNSTYYFSFNYEGSKITPQWDTKIPLSGVEQVTPASYGKNPQQFPEIPPNHLNITINNTQSTNPEKLSYNKLIEKYGLEIVDTSLQIAKGKGMEENISYVEGVCKNLSMEKKGRMPNNNQSLDSAQHIIDSWKNFLDWSKIHLTRTSIDILENIAIEVDGRTIFIQKQLSDFLRQIILKYFKEEISPSIIIIFAEVSEKSYPR